MSCFVELRGNIREIVRPYFAMFRMRWIAGLQYRTAAWAGIATQYFWGAISIMVMVAFYNSTTSEPPMPLSHAVSYQWLRQAFLAIIALYVTSDELISQILNGHVAYSMIKPFDLYTFWYAHLAGQRLANVALRFLPVLLLAYILPAPYGLMLPPSVGALGLFALSLAISLLLVTAVSMFVYILTFIMLSPYAARLIVGIPSEFLMGALIPVPLMPESLQRALDFLPFRYIADLPFRLYTGGINGADAYRQLLIQLIWTAALILIGRASMKHIQRRIVIQGG
ncbi:ABC transporter permease [Clostridia bacterium]|nr:ABC transporter permease [Clostridia bacterium]